MDFTKFVNKGIMNIVESLRIEAKNEVGKGDKPLADLLNEAADKIEWLRSKLKNQYDDLTIIGG